MREREESRMLLNFWPEQSKVVKEVGSYIANDSHFSRFERQHGNLYQKPLNSHTFRTTGSNLIFFNKRKSLCL